MPPPKITDVAKLAGVSTATVSRALNKPNSVADETRNAVMAAAAKTGYRINLAARNLRRGRSGAAVVLVPNLGNPFFSEILSGIEATLATTGLSVLVADTKHPGVPPSLLLEYLHSSRVDGVISLDGSLPDILAMAPSQEDLMPPIVYACEWNDSATSPTVRVDNRAGAALAVGHLADLGHVRIGQVSGPANNILTHERREGAFGELHRRGLPVMDEWVFDGDFTIASGQVAAEIWSGMKERPTAIFCASDEIAFGFISELHAKGIKVPQEVSVVGFDDIEIAKHYFPPLTTVRQPRNELGASAANILLGLIDGSVAEALNKDVILPVELVVRSSATVPTT